MNRTTDIQDLCLANIWTENLIWSTENPYVIQCIQNTLLVWIPTVAIAILSPFYLYDVLSSGNKKIPWNWYNVTKLLLTSTLIACSVAALAFSNVSSEFYSPFLNVIVYTGVLVMMYFQILAGIQSSAPLCIFWIFTALSVLIQTIIEIQLIKISFIRASVVNFIQYSVVFILFILHFWADKEPSSYRYTSSERPSPEMKSSFFARIFYTWFDPFIWKGFRRPIERKDLWTMNYEDSSEFLTLKFNRFWNKKLQKGKDMSVLLIIVKLIWKKFLFGSFLRFIYTLLGFVAPLLVGVLISYVENYKIQPACIGYLAAVLMFATLVTETFVLTRQIHLGYLSGLRAQTALICAIYNKALRISNSVRKSTTIGEIINLMAVDADKFKDLSYLNLVWLGPLEIIITFCILWTLIGPSVLAALVVAILFAPVNIYISNKWQLFQTKQMAYKDKRIKLMGEILNCIKILKLYAWELSFENQVLKIREKEMQMQRRVFFMQALISFLWFGAPFLMSLVSFTTFVLINQDNILNYRTAFVSFTLFNNLRLPLTVLPIVISDLIQIKISLKRLNKFLNAEELNTNDIQHDKSEGDIALSIQKGNFSWNGENILKNINLVLTKGTLNIVIGSVGCGKSSLISSFLGEMTKTSGTVSISGEVAYVSQQAWIQNTTLRNNILFGKEFQPGLYKEVIEACALVPDLKLLPGGDLAEIGESGVNLSGGQKQRINLARAVYSNKDIYFLDDPLSAVDVHVGKHIFDKVFGSNGILKSKTRFLVTHNLTFLPFASSILVVKDGEVKKFNTYTQLLEDNNTFFEYLKNCDSKNSVEMNNIKNSNNNIIEEKKNILNDLEEDELFSSKGKLTEIENAEVGTVKWGVYLYYMKSAGFLFFACAFLLNTIFQALNIAGPFWLSVWSGDPDPNHSSQSLYIGVYTALGIGQAVASAFSDLTPLLACWTASYVIHQSMLRAVLRAPINFYNSVPIGRIIARFSKDVDIVDTHLPSWISDSIWSFFSIVATFIVISYTAPFLIIFIVPIAVVFYFLRSVYLSSSRQTRRLESVSRSPIFSHFNESISGASVIRAYNEQTRFTTECQKRVDANNMCSYPLIIAPRWLNVRLEMFCNLVLFLTTLFFVYNAPHVSPGVVGICLSFSLNLIGTVNWFIHNSSLVETNIVSVERLKEYSDLRPEAAWKINKLQLSPTWPEKGEIRFSNYSLRYRDDLELVLKNLNFVIKAGEKVGIVGRTGAGKSTITLALFRIMEASEGAINIDGVDISTLGLHLLRNRLTIIPQDPILFSGTIRLNLDPFETYSDSDIWQALEHAHLKDTVQNLVGNLNHEVVEKGENFSVGQRQLICLARALLRKTKILILDEATAAVDIKTDELIQNTVRGEFSDCTVLTIAHRLNTIMDSDRVLVIDKGLVQEFDKPEKLLQNHTSFFYKMVQEINS